MSQRYYRFSDREDVALEFEYGARSGSVTFTPAEDFPADEQILFANYGSWSYDGDAFVLFERDGKLYEVMGSHCSCYGLEGQWEPEETTWGALAMRVFDKKYFSDGAKEAIEALIASRAPLNTPAPTDANEQLDATNP